MLVGRRAESPTSVGGHFDVNTVNNLNTTSNPSVGPRGLGGGHSGPAQTNEKNWVLGPTP
jgi:hypothetical protein